MNTMTLSKGVRSRITQLANQIVAQYHLKDPPVPVETILSNPPGELEGVDITDLSLVFGAGEHRHEYRLGLGRLLYREICRAGLEAPPMPYTGEAARAFAKELLAPAMWLKPAAQRPGVTLQDLGEEFQLPEYTVASRLVELGLWVEGME
jgi:hypothetical protein